MSQLQKVVNLIKKTGDKAIILDENGDPNYVVMTISDYESLILGKSEVRGLTDQELLAKINREIAIWKEDNEREKIPVDQQDFLRDLGNFSEVYEDIDDDEDGFEPIGEVIRDMNFIPDNNEFNDDSDDFFEENSEYQDDDDKFYFEPVE